MWKKPGGIHASQLELVKLSRSLSFPFCLVRVNDIQLRILAADIHLSDYGISR